jgi:hypothetical protein
VVIAMDTHKRSVTIEAITGTEGASAEASSLGVAHVGNPRKRGHNDGALTPDSSVVDTAEAGQPGLVNDDDRIVIAGRPDRGRRGRRCPLPALSWDVLHVEWSNVWRPFSNEDRVAGVRR